MRRLMILSACLCVLPLAACSAPPLPSSPAAAAQATTLDEHALAGVELAYKAARTASELAVDAGLVKGTAASKLAVVDNDAYAAVQLARAAYAAGNADSYAGAVADALPRIEKFRAFVAAQAGDDK